MKQPDITEDDLSKLVERVREAAGALMQGAPGSAGPGERIGPKLRTTTLVSAEGAAG